MSCGIGRPTRRIGPDGQPALLEEEHGFLAKDDLLEDMALSEQLVKSQDIRRVIGKGEQGVESCSVYCVYLYLCGVRPRATGSRVLVCFQAQVARFSPPSCMHCVRNRVPRPVMEDDRYGLLSPWWRMPEGWSMPVLANHLLIVVLDTIYEEALYSVDSHACVTNQSCDTRTKDLRS